MDAGDRFGDYVIIKRLASGGMAQVYLARKSGVGGFTKPLAMKVILPQYASNREFITMFLDEARLAVFLTHANIAQVIDLGEVDSQYFIAMEFAHGKDLQQISRMTRKRGRLLPLPYAAKIVSQIAEGLYYAHTKSDNRGQPLGIVHRDISPHNIILTFDGLAKLIDFGIAKASVTYKEEEEGVLKGKFSYMSPEQIRGMPVDPRSDIFALGIVLWEICTGASLYRESSELLTMEAILRKPVPKPRELRGDMPEDLEAIILRSLAKRSVDRFQTAVEMHEALEDYLNRSGWNVGTPHLSEFMRKLFPDDYTEIRDLIQAERVEAEQEDLLATQKAQEFVAWVPYDQEGKAAEPAPVPQPAVAADEDDDMAVVGGGFPEAGRGGVAARPSPAPVVPTTGGPLPTTGQVPVRNGTPVTTVVIIVLLALLAVVGSVIILILATGEEKIDSQVEGVVATSGTIKVESNPPGADVYINGKPHGKTPVDIRDLPLGEDLTVKLELSGYDKYYIPVRLSAKRHTTAVLAELKKK